MAARKSQRQSKSQTPTCNRQKTWIVYTNWKGLTLTHRNIKSFGLDFRRINYTTTGGAPGIDSLAPSYDQGSLRAKFGKGIVPTLEKRSFGS